YRDRVEVMSNTTNNNTKKLSGSGTYYTAGGGVTMKGMINFLAEATMAFINFSLLVEYISIIWFYPMGFMGFTGMEAFLVVYFSPLLLGIGVVRRLLSGRVNTFVRLVAQLMALAALYPYHIDTETVEKHEIDLWRNPHVTKTVFVGAGLALDWLCQSRLFVNNASATRRDRVSYAYIVAIAVQTLIRLPYLSVNPFMTWRDWIVAGAALVALSFVVLMFDSSSSGENSTEVRRPTQPHSATLVTGISFGGVLFTSQLFLSSHGIVPRWVNLLPYPSGIVIIIALLVGIVLSRKSSIVSSQTYFFTALAMGVLFGFCSGSVPFSVSLVGLAAGSFLVAYTISLWPTIIEKMSNSNRTFLLFVYGFLTYVVLLFWAIIVVSYKFLPWFLGANLFRERHQTMVIAAIITTGLAAVMKTRTTLPKKEAKSSNSLPREVVYLIFSMLVLLLLFSVNRSLTHATDASVAGNHYERIINSTHIQNIPPKEIKSMIWTIHFGYDNYGRNSFSNITDAIRGHGANVIGLLESDLSRIMTSNRDLVEWLSSELHMYSDFGPAPSENTWGCALLSVFPIVSSNHVILPSPEGELACLIDAIITVNETPVNVIVTHFGNTEDELDRKLQAAGAAEIVKKNDMPTVFLSYITEKTGGNNYKTLMASGLQDTTAERRYCQYLFYKGLDMGEFKRWGCGEISDTEGQLATFTTKPVVNNNADAADASAPT
ncbi:hypothetical protein SAMD00019534_014050, partial [Acytostelium subglobosum LB1]|uniref:hypothetical protein n=1 Tax=Acytostelium subglobosum LB1 TaxID=1410327 RepID=UPI000644A8E3